VKTIFVRLPRTATDTTNHVELWAICGPKARQGLIQAEKLGEYICLSTHKSTHDPLDPQLMSPAMKRAREPFRVKNAITGVLLAAFGVGMWAYSIRSVKQDNFDDVDEEAKSLAAARQQSLAKQRVVGAVPVPTAGEQTPGRS